MVSLLRLGSQESERDFHQNFRRTKIYPKIKRCSSATSTLVFLAYNSHFIGENGVKETLDGDLLVLVIQCDQE